VRDRLDALAAARGMDPADLVAELVLEADIAEKVDEVNAELERLVETRPARRRRRAQTQRLEQTVEGWMRA